MNNADLALALRKAADTFDTAPLIREGILRMAADALDYLDIPPVPTTGLLTTEEWRDFQSIPDQGYSHRFWIDAKIEQRVQAERERLTAPRTDAEAAVVPTDEREALIAEARSKAEWRWPIPINYLPGDSEHTTLTALRHAYVLGAGDFGSRALEHLTPAARAQGAAIAEAEDRRSLVEALREAEAEVERLTAPRTDAEVKAAVRAYRLKREEQTASPVSRGVLSMASIHARTSEAVCAALDAADKVRATRVPPVHWIGDAPTSLHGNGAASFESVTRDETDVTCKLCLSILARETPNREDGS